MGTSVVGRQSLPQIPGQGFDRVISPYLADIDTNMSGTVRYTRFLTHHPDKPRVVSFIKEKTGVSLPTVRPNTVSMMVVEWNHVAQADGNSVSSTLISHDALLVCNTVQKVCMPF